MKKFITVIFALIVLSVFVVSCTTPDALYEDKSDVKEEIKLEVSSTTKAPENTKKNGDEPDLPAICATADRKSISAVLEKLSYSTTEKIRVTLNNNSGEPFDICTYQTLQRLDSETGKWETVSEESAIRTVLITVESKITDIYFDLCTLNNSLTDGTYRLIINLPNDYIVSPEFTVYE